MLVACACVHPWYGLADTGRDHALAFVLGHAWARKAVHGSKTTCDRQAGDRHHRPLRHPPAVLLLRPPVRRRPGVGRPARRHRQPQGRQRLAEVGLRRGRRPQRPEGRTPRRPAAAAVVPAGPSEGVVGAGPQAGPRLLSPAAHQGGLCCPALREALSHGAAGEPRPNGSRGGQPSRGHPAVRGPRVRHGGPWPPPRHPAGWMGRRPRPPSDCGGPTTGPRPGGGSGDERDQRAAVPSKRAWCRSTLPRSTRPPPERPGAGGKRRTTRPAREPSRTGPSLGGGEPAELRRATEPGPNAYRDRPGRCPWHSRLALRGGAARVRRRVGCGSSAACRPGVASAPDEEAGSPRAVPRPPLAVTSEKTASRKAPLPVAVDNIFSCHREPYELPRRCAA
jgi:hypothetical protein